MSSPLRTTALALTLIPPLLAPRAAAADPASARPDPAAQAGGDPDRIAIGAWLIDIDGIDSAGQRFVSNLFLALRWQDPRVAHGGAVPEIRPAGEVWMPLFLIANETGIVRRTLPEQVEVQGDGTVIYRQRFVGSFSQRLDLAHFPFDEHLFQIQLVFPDRTKAELELVPDERLEARGMPGAVGVADLISLSDWEVRECSARSQPYVLVPGLEVPGYAIGFQARRDTLYWVWKILLPLALIVAMSWSVFWIDPANSGTQIGVATTAMLTLIAYRFAIETRVPPVSYMTRLDWFLSGSTLLVFLTLCVSITCSRLVALGRPPVAARLQFVSRFLFPAAFVVSAYWSLSR